MDGPRCYDGGKKVEERNHHLLVGTQGTLPKSKKMHPANLHERAGTDLLLCGLQHLFPLIERMWADTAYHGLKDWPQTAPG
jgi:putative transposase